MEKILIVGATGTTGNQIVNILKDHASFQPVAMIRKESQRQQFEQNGIETILGDLTEDISDITKDVDKVIFAAGSSGKAVEAVDKLGAMKLTDASKRHHIKKFVMLSSMGADAPQEADELQEYLQAKRDADEYLANSGLTYTIVRPGALNNDMPTGKIRLAKKLSQSEGEIPRGDVAKVLVACLDDHIAKRRVFEILNGEQIISHAINELEAVTA